MTLYLDTGSLVKLYVAEAGSDVVRQLVEQADIVATAAIAYPEARAALARRRREGAFDRGPLRPPSGRSTRTGRDTSPLT